MNKIKIGIYFLKDSFVGIPAPCFLVGRNNFCWSLTFGISFDCSMALERLCEWRALSWLLSEEWELLFLALRWFWFRFTMVKCNRLKKWVRSHWGILTLPPQVPAGTSLEPSVFTGSKLQVSVLPGRWGQEPGTQPCKAVLPAGKPAYVVPTLRTAACSQPFAGASQPFLMPVLQLSLLRCQQVAEGTGAESHSAPKRGVVQGNTSKKDTALFLCVRFAIARILLGLSDGGMSRPWARADQYCLHVWGEANQHSQPELFQCIFPGTQFKTNPNYSSAFEIILKRIAFCRVQWILDCRIFSC